MPTLTPVSVTLFAGAVGIFLYLDLRQHRSAETVSVRNALAWSATWFALALGFAAFIGVRYGGQNAWAFLAGYLLEESLSVDNLFVFMAVFSSFAVRDAYQHRILYFGILGAVVMRLAFIAAGTRLFSVGELGEAWHMAVFGLFGAMVLVSALQMVRAFGSDDSQAEDYTHHWSVRWASRLFPVHPRLDGKLLFTRVDGRLKATPLFLCLVAVEASDLAFAFDSVPAVIAVTREPFLVYTSNVFAILGLRSLYFVLSAARRYLNRLESAIVVILVFVGIKLVLEALRGPITRMFGAPFQVSPGESLLVVLGVLALGVIASFLFPAHPTEREGERERKSEH